MDYNTLKKIYESQNILCPTPDMIKSKEQIDGIREAGIINTKVLDYVASRIRSGMSTQDIDNLVSTYTKELGAICAPLGYNGFPKSCCTSINSQVCHGIPSEKDILKDGDIVNVDVTSIYKGFYADSSRMFKIGIVSSEAIKICNVAENALNEALKILKPFIRLGDIGHAIESYVNKMGCSVVHEIGGHGVGISFHEDPYIAHYGRKNTGMILFPGMVFTIEPMVNIGKRFVYLDALNNWTVYTKDNSLSAQVEHTVLITETGYEILAK